MKRLWGIVLLAVLLFSSLALADEGEKKPLFVYPWTANLQTISVGIQVDRWVLDPKVAIFFKPVNYLPTGLRELVGTPAKMPMGVALSTELRLVAPKKGWLGLGFGSVL